MSRWFVPKSSILETMDISFIMLMEAKLAPVLIAHSLICFELLIFWQLSWSPLGSVISSREVRVFAILRHRKSGHDRVRANDGQAPHRSGDVPVQ